MFFCLKVKQQKKAKYYLETPGIFDKISLFCWEIDLVNTEPVYEPPDYKNPTDILIQVKSDINENIFIRRVLVEKIKQKTKKIKTLSELGFFERWSIISVFEDTHILKGIQRENDFKLLKILTDGTIVKTWILKKCTLKGSSMWGHNQLDEHEEKGMIGTFLLKINSFHELH